jgi:hypothetical protein
MSATEIATAAKELGALRGGLTCSFAEVPLSRLADVLSMS